MSEQTPAPLFTEGQRRLLAFTVGFFALVASGALLIFLFALSGKLIGHFAHVLWPLAVAGILALMLRPLVDLVERRTHGRRTLAVVTLYALFVAAIACLLVVVVPPLASQILDFIAYVPKLWANGVEYVKLYSPRWIEVFNRLMENPTIAATVTAIQDQAARIPAFLLPSLKVISEGAWASLSFLMHLAIVPIYLFFFLLSRTDGTRRLPEHLPFLSPSVRADVVFLVQEFIAIVVSFFRGQLLIGLMMGVLYAIGFSVVGLKFGLFIGLLLGLLNIIPYLGTILGIAITIPLALLQEGGGLQLVALVLGVKVAVQTLEGWVLTPKIMGDRTGLHPVTIIVAVFFWGTALDGVLGMVLAIPLTAFFVTAWRLLKYKYLPAA